MLWIVQNVLRRYFMYETRELGMQYDGFEPIRPISIASHDVIIGEYVGHLLISKNFKMAYLACLLFDDQALRKRTIKRIFGIIQHHMQSKCASNQHEIAYFLFSVLHLPNSML